MLGTRDIVGVIGSGEEDPELNSLAREVGGLIASNGFILLNGGLLGVMQASSKGAREKGGLTVAILPGLDPESANPYVDIRIPTGLGELRNLLIVRASRALIAVGGGYGTLSEIALALKLKKPVIGLKTWNVSEEIIAAETPEDALRKLEAVITGP